MRIIHVTHIILLLVGLVYGGTYERIGLEGLELVGKREGRGCR